VKENTLKLAKVIMHRIPKKTGEADSPTEAELSDVPSPHDDETQIFLRSAALAAQRCLQSSSPRPYPFKIGFGDNQSADRSVSSPGIDTLTQRMRPR
jgi:hypothetical protein